MVPKILPRTVYLMRLWRDGTVSIIYSGRTVEGALRFNRDLVQQGGPYDGRHYLAYEPLVRPAPRR